MPKHAFAGRRSRGWLGLVIAVAAVAALYADAFVGPRLAAARAGARRGQARREPRRSAASGGNDDGAAPAAPKKLWSLFMTRRGDHYVWRDEASFVGIVADAGEWEVDPEAIRDAFARAQSGEETVEVFGSAPLYVVKDYVRELQNYGLHAEARESAPVEGEDDPTWRRRDWKQLSPDQKESVAASRAEQDEAMEGNTMSVVVARNDHQVFDGTKSSSMKFKAYVEMAADAAKRFAPEDALLHRCYEQIVGPRTRSTVLTALSPDAAEAAAKQLRSAGFDATTEVETRKATVE